MGDIVELKRKPDQNRDHILQALDAVRQGIEAGVVEDVVLLATTLEGPEVCALGAKGTPSLRLLGLVALAERRLADWIDSETEEDA